MSDADTPVPEAAAAAPPQPQSPRRRWLLWLLLAPLLLVLALPLLVYGLLASEAGTSWLLRQASSHAPTAGVQFTYAHSRGTLLGRLELDDVALSVAGSEVDVGSLQLQWRPRDLWQRLLHVESLSLSGVRVRPPPTSASASGPPELPDVVLPIALRVDRFAVDDLQVTQSDGVLVLQHLALSAALDNDGLRIADLVLLADGARVAGEATLATRTPHALEATLDALLPAHLTGDEVGEVSLRARVAGVALRPELAVDVVAPTPLQLRGDVALDAMPLRFALDARWPRLQWPLRGTSQVVTDEGSLRIDGTADDYRAVLRTALEASADGLPAMTIALDAHGNQQGMTLAPLRVSIAEGTLQADGRIDWQGGVRWQLQLMADALDPAQFSADWPGELAARINVDGALDAAGAPSVEATIDDLSGTLRGYPVAARGALGWRSAVLSVTQLELASGSNRLHVDGRLAERLDFTFDIDAPDLAGVYPGLAGRLQGRGRLGGSVERPLVSAELEGGELAFAGVRAATLALNVDWRGDDGTGELQMTDVRQGDMRATAVTASLDGRVDAHRLRLAADAPDLRVALAASGGLDDGLTTWRGTLQDLDVRTSELGEWRLRQPAALRLAASEAAAEQLCLAQAATTLCARGVWSQAKGLDVAAGLDAFDLATLSRFLPGEAEIDGRLAASVAINGPPQRPSARFELRPSDGVIRVREGLEPFEIAYGDARLQGQFADDRGAAELSFALGENGRADGRVTLAAADKGDRRLGGRVTANFPDLALVAGFVPALQAVKGRLALALDLGGTLAQPSVVGDVRVSDASANVPAAGIELREFGLHVRGDGLAPLQVDGSVLSGDGRLTLSGTVDPAADGGPGVDLRIRGNDFQAVRLPEASAWVSPDLRLSGAGNYLLSGKLLIPRAKIELKELPKGTVAVSGDEVIVGEDGVVEARTTTGSVSAKVRVELGDAVTFKGFGLSTRLAGSVDAASGPRGTVVDGKIELKDARYEAYGQDLTVERGRLLFAGPPADPDVDLRAVRESRDGTVKAYLALSGPLSKPRPRVYTEPTLPEAQAVAYLLTGRGLDDVGQGEGVDVVGAALSLGLSRSEPLLQNLGDRLGLDDVKIESGNNGLSDSSLLLGKYLNPDLYLGYSQSLFSPEGAVLLRLKLNRRLELESRSGTEQSVDLFYKIER